jgi:hypothetical protein
MFGVICTNLSLHLKATNAIYEETSIFLIYMCIITNTEKCMCTHINMYAYVHVHKHT